MVGCAGWVVLCATGERTAAPGEYLTKVRDAGLALRVCAAEYRAGGAEDAAAAAAAAPPPKQQQRRHYF